MGFQATLGQGRRHLVGKYIRPQNCTFSDIFGPDVTRRAVEFCMDNSHLPQAKFGQVWGSSAPLPVVAGKLRARKAPLWTFVYHMEKSVAFCDVTPGLQSGHRKVCFRGFVLGKQAKIRKLGNFEASQLRICTSYRKVGRISETPWPLDYKWSKQ